MAVPSGAFPSCAACRRSVSPSAKRATRRSTSSERARPPISSSMRRPASACRSRSRSMASRPPIRPSATSERDSPPMISLLEKAQVSRSEAGHILDSALKGADDGELFIEQRLTEQAVFDDGRLKSASFDEAQGFGLRVVSGETQGYSHSTDVSAAAMQRASDICRTIISGPSSGIWTVPQRTNRQLYVAQNPSDHFPFADKMALLQRVDEFARGADPRIRQVTISLSGDWQEIEILRAGGEAYRDSRPLVRFSVTVMASDGKERASGTYGFGGRALYGDYL